MSTLLHPGQIIAFAHEANPTTWGNPMDADYLTVVTNFLALLNDRHIPLVVVGGIALLQHVPGRNTEDLDLILSTPGLSQLPELEVHERSEMFAHGTFQGLRVDVLFAEHPVFDLVAARFTAPMDYQIGQLATATIDGLILLKLFALPSLYRQFDFDRIAIYEADLTQLLSRSREPDSFFLNSLAPHISDSDQSELADILGDIRRRLQRMKKP